MAELATIALEVIDPPIEVVCVIVITVVLVLSSTVERISVVGGADINASTGSELDVLILEVQ